MLLSREQLNNTGKISFVQKNKSKIVEREGGGEVSIMLH